VGAEHTVVPKKGRHLRESTCNGKDTGSQRGREVKLKESKAECSKKEREGHPLEEEGEGNDAGKFGQERPGTKNKRKELALEKGKENKRGEKKQMAFH